MLRIDARARRVPSSRAGPADRGDAREAAEEAARLAAEEAARRAAEDAARWAAEEPARRAAEEAANSGSSIPQRSLTTSSTCASSANSWGGQASGVRIPLSGPSLALTT